jgi:tRNA A37 threonylcarbamoyladenosine modification protein TsaB
MTVLQINTATGQDSIEVSILENGENTVTQMVSCDGGDTQQVVAGIMEVLGATEPEGIVLIQGAQRFTVSRLGGVVANALAMSKHIPVWSTGQASPAWDTVVAEIEQSSSLITIEYSQEPSIG